MAGSTLASPSTDAKAPVAKAVAHSPGKEAWRRFKRHKLAVLCTVVLSIIVLAVVIINEVVKRWDDRRIQHKAAAALETVAVPA